VSLSRRELLRRGAALAAGLSAVRLGWLERAFAATPSVAPTLRALVMYVVARRDFLAAPPLRSSALPARARSCG
jgi:hypothetical protein